MLVHCKLACGECTEIVTRNTSTETATTEEVVQSTAAPSTTTTAGTTEVAVTTTAVATGARFNCINIIGRRRGNLCAGAGDNSRATVHDTASRDRTTHDFQAPKLNWEGECSHLTLLGRQLACRLH